MSRCGLLGSVTVIVNGSLEQDTLRERRKVESTVIPTLGTIEPCLVPPLHGSIKGSFYFEDMSFADARPCISLLPKHHFEHGERERRRERKRRRREGRRERYVILDIGSFYYSRIILSPAAIPIATKAQAKALIVVLGLADLGAIFVVLLPPNAVLIQLEAH